MFAMNIKRYNNKIKLYLNNIKSHHRHFGGTGDIFNPYSLLFTALAVCCFKGSMHLLLPESNDFSFKDILEKLFMGDF